MQPSQDMAEVEALLSASRDERHAFGNPIVDPALAEAQLAGQLLLGEERLTSGGSEAENGHALTIPADPRTVNGWVFG